MADGMSKDKSTAANREYWTFVEENAREVEDWPKWMRGERSEVVQASQADRADPEADAEVRHAASSSS